MIVSNNQVQNVLKVYGKKADRVKNNKTESQTKSDALTLSKEAKEIQILSSKVKETLAQTPEIRAQKVEDLKKKVSEGKYNVSSDTIAEKMLGRSILDDVLRD